MGKWFNRIARKGAVGGTARHVADWYKVQIVKAEAIGMNPNTIEDAETAEVCRSGFIANLVNNCVSARSSSGLKNRNDHVLISLVQKGHIMDLLGLTLAILVCEARFTRNALEHQIEFLKVVVEELTNAGVPDEYICRGNLLDALRDSNPTRAILCLGDEYQNIVVAVG